jgi:hypothetical protein
VRALRDVLRSGGHVAVIDFRMDSPVGPPRAARIEPVTVKGELERAGFALVREHGFPPHQYSLVFAAAGQVSKGGLLQQAALTQVKMACMPKA